MVQPIKYFDTDVPAARRARLADRTRHQDSRWSLAERTVKPKELTMANQIDTIDEQKRRALEVAIAQIERKNFRSRPIPVVSLAQRRREDDGKRWRTIYPHTSDHYPCACVYAVYVKGRVVYVGSTTDFARRWQEHRRAPVWERGHEITLKIKLSARLGDWLMREYRLILRLRPACNRAHTTPNQKTLKIQAYVRSLRGGHHGR